MAEVSQKAPGGILDQRGCRRTELKEMQTRYKNEGCGEREENLIEENECLLVL